MMTNVERQNAYLETRFRELLQNPTLPVIVDWTANEEIVVYHNPKIVATDPSSCGDESFWIMEIGSDDDRYRFELWVRGRDTGTYVEFPLPGETL